MVVSIDRYTAVKMYDKVRKYWQKYMEELRKQLAECQPDEATEIKKKLYYMQETDMAVVVSSGQNEVEEFKKKGLDILPHRKRMINEDLDKKFKDPNDPLRIVFVCAMWLTGFDAPAVNTIYLDKPMQNHTLMQTIARANRVFKDKTCGTIVDYIGVFRNLQKALAIYATPAAGGSVDTPVKEKAALIDELKKAVTETIKREKLVLDWRKRQQTRAAVLITIQDSLDRELPRAYTPEIFKRKCDLVYQHIYDCYYSAGQSVYSQAG